MIDNELEYVEIKNRWTGAVMFRCELNAELRGATLGVKLGFAAKKAFEISASLVGASLVGANLDGANLNRASLIGASLDHASLIGASLIGASLDGASLIGASLDGANLNRASLDHASLIGASLIGASLIGASLIGASLDGANLAGASLIDASLIDASLIGASLIGAKIRDGITINRAPLQISGLYYPVIIFDAHMQIRCEFHALSDWRAFDDRRIAQMDGNAALKFWHAHGAALLALAASDKRGVDVAEARE